jgi:hypothetical protein
VPKKTQQPLPPPLRPPPDGVYAGAGRREGALRAAPPLAGRFRRGNPQGLPLVRANLPSRQVPGPPGTAAPHPARLSRLKLLSSGFLGAWLWIGFGVARAF